jgi:8-oxo-dGTP diphosphatase
MAVAKGNPENSSLHGERGGQRKYPDRPIVGVGAVIFEGQKVLLVKRGREPALGEWSIPGGCVDLGETLEQALIREVYEETHLQVEVLALVKVLERIFREPDERVAYHYVLIDFLCGCRGGTLLAGSDAAEAQFVPLRELSCRGLAPVTLHVIQRADGMRKKKKGGEIPPELRGYYG